MSASRIRRADSPQASQRCPNSGAISTHSEIGKRGRLKSGCLHGIEGSSPPACITTVAGRTVNQVLTARRHGSSEPARLDIAGRCRDSHSLSCRLAICKKKPGVPNAPGFFFLLVSLPTDLHCAPLGRGQRLEARNRRAVFACDRLDLEALSAGLIGPRLGASFAVRCASSHSVSFEAEHDKVTQRNSIGKLRRIGRRSGLNFWVYFFSHYQSPCATRGLHVLPSPY